jgi:hypothetical protein
MISNKNVSRNKTTRRRSRMAIAVIAAIILTLGMTVIPAIG